jgi:hypothetical protein
MLARVVLTISRVVRVICILPIMKFGRVIWGTNFLREIIVIIIIIFRLDYLMWQRFRVSSKPL